MSTCTHRYFNYLRFFVHPLVVRFPPAIVALLWSLSSCPPGSVDAELRVSRKEFGMATRSREPAMTPDRPNAVGTASTPLWIW